MIDKKSEDQNKLKKYLFRLTVNHPDMWLSKGHELKRGADAMLASHHDQLYMLLIAFSFENLFKGILMCGDLKTESKLTLKKWSGLSHDLLRLSKKCKFSINDGEEDVLKRLTIFSVYRGRYPAPVEPDDYNEVTKHESGSIGANVFYSSNDPCVIKKIYDRLEKNLRLKIRYLEKVRNEI